MFYGFTTTVSELGSLGFLYYIDFIDIAPLLLFAVLTFIPGIDPTISGIKSTFHFNI